MCERSSSKITGDYRYVSHCRSKFKTSPLSRGNEPPVIPSSSSASAMLVTSEAGGLHRMTTEEIADRLHSHGTGTKNILPGCVVSYALMLTAALTLDSAKQMTNLKQCGYQWP